MTFDDSYQKYIIQNNFHHLLTYCTCIGNGAFGEAYAISNELILKVTKDHFEASNAIELVDKNYPNTVKIYDVQYDFDNNLYLILQERLKIDEDLITFYFQYINFDIDMIDDEQYIMDFIIDMINDEQYIMDNDTEDEELICNEINSFEIHKDGISKFLNDIANHQNVLNYTSVVSADIHPENIGQNSSGDFVVFDISYSGSSSESILEQNITKINELQKTKISELQIKYETSTPITTTQFTSNLFENFTATTTDRNYEIYKSPIPLLHLLEDINIQYRPIIHDVSYDNDLFIVESEIIDYSIKDYALNIIYSMMENKKIPYDDNFSQFHEKIITAINSFIDHHENSFELFQLTSQEYNESDTLEILSNATFGVDVHGNIKIKNIVLDDYLNNSHYINDNIRTLLEKYNHKKSLNNTFSI